MVNHAPAVDLGHAPSIPALMYLCIKADHQILHETLELGLMVWHSTALRPACECTLEFILTAAGVRAAGASLPVWRKASSSDTVWLPRMDGIQWILSFPLAYWDDKDEELLGPGIKGS